MNDRVELLGATLDHMEEGVVILDERLNVLFWNKAAAALTGHSALEMVGRPLHEDLYRMDEKYRGRASDRSGHKNGFNRNNTSVGLYNARMIYALTDGTALSDPEPDIDEQDRQPGYPVLVSMNHKLGHSAPAMLRKTTLRDSCGAAFGTSLLFYPVEEFDTLPHGEDGGCGDIEHSQADLEDRLEAAHHQWMIGRVSYSLLWITVDQAELLRTTHGRDACEAMLRIVEQTLLRQMKPAEIIGRWGNNEFLVLTHERTAELLIEHAQRLAGVARTADFRWWGDRVGLTVSIGASAATEGHTLQSLLNRARQAMRTAAYAGGNQVTEARGT